MSDGFDLHPSGCRCTVHASEPPTERDVEDLAVTIAHDVGDWEPDDGAFDIARAVLASDWFAERIVEARREGAVEVEARVLAVVDDPKKPLRNAVMSDDIRAALRGDA